MSNRSIKWVIGFGIVAIVAILTVQAYFFYNAFDYEKRQTEQSIRISLQAVAENISEFNNTTLPDGIIHQFKPDYYIVDINNHIDPGIIEFYMESELTRRHLHLDFEYAIYNCEDDRMVYGNYVPMGEDMEVKRKLNEWPKYEEGIYYFGVHFPGLRKNIMGEMQLWYFFSGILLIVIVFFGYSMMIILQQKRLSEVQRDFINNMSHEFRTPLTSVSLAADVLAEEGILNEPERLRKYTSILSEQIRLLHGKTDKILRQAEIEHKTFSLQKEKLSITEILDEIEEEFTSVLKLKKGKLIFELSIGEVDIFADRFHLNGVLINLIDNAIKYSPGPPEVTIKVSGREKKIFIEVSDKGIGIDKKDLRRVFMPFFRVPSGNVHNVKGSGLGLSYVKKICNLHHWKIEIDSEPGKGTRVLIVIPKA